MVGIYFVELVIPDMQQNCFVINMMKGLKHFR